MTLLHRIERDPGDRWTLYHGEGLTILRDLPDSLVDALITDAPYSSGGQYRSDRAASTNVKYANSEQVGLYDDFEGDNRDQRSWIMWVTLWLCEAYRVSKPGAPVLLFCDWRMLPATTDALQAGGFVWRGIVPWDKGEGTRPQPGRFRSQAEYVVWGSKGPMPLDRDAPVLPGVFRVTVRKDDKFHLTGKPTRLMAELVKIAERGGTVLDPFMGSGTTCYAAVMQGFKAIGIELHAGYFDTACRRMRGEAIDVADGREGEEERATTIFDWTPDEVKRISAELPSGAPHA